MKADAVYFFLLQNPPAERPPASETAAAATRGDLHYLIRDAGNIKLKSQMRHRIINRELTHAWDFPK